MTHPNCDFLVVGAGLFGLTFAQQVATRLKKSVLVIEKRDHIGGNCFSKVDPESGIEYHQYGTHIFHTSNTLVWNYLNQFTKFNTYHHQVLTTYQDKVYQLPINLETINSFYNVNLRPFEVGAFIKEIKKKNPISNPSNLEEWAISQIGRDLYEAFIKGYTKKQWGVDPSQLPKNIIKRLPIRSNYCEDYFHNCRYQGIPEKGYGEMFERMVDHPLIKIELEQDYLKNRNKGMYRPRYKTLYTGPIDQYFENCFGSLGWRSIRLEKEIINHKDYQGTSVMNYADELVPFTRIHEPKHLHPERNYDTNHSLILKEYSNDDYLEPYYPINNKSNRSTYKRYFNEVSKIKDFIIGGRLADYAYYDMDMTILAALNKFNYILKKYN